MKSVLRKLCVILSIALITLISIPQPITRAAETPRTNYQIDLRLDAPIQRLYEHVTVTAVNDSADVWDALAFRDYMDSLIALADAQLDYVELDEDGNVLWGGLVIPEGKRHASGESGITSASVDGKPAEIEVNDADASIVFVRPESSIAPGACFTVELDYFADVMLGSYRACYTRLHEMNFNTDEEYQRFLRCEGDTTFELGQFYPTLALYEGGEWILDPYIEDGECFYSRCADYSLTVSAPEDYTVIASGTERRLDTADGVSAWSVEAYNMRDVTLIISNELQKRSATASGVTVNSWFVTDDGTDSARELMREGDIMLEAAQTAVDAFTQAYGAYPYDELDVVESCYGGGMEAPGLVRISIAYSWMLDDYIFDTMDINPATATEPNVTYADRCRGTVAHEVAHEWFYAAVGNNQYREAWLDESFAAFSEYIYWRALGRDEHTISRQLNAFAETCRHGDYTVDRPYDALENENYLDYIDAVYRRGAGFLYRLQRLMGEKRFFEFIQEYYAKYSLSEATTADFVSMLRPYIDDNMLAHEQCGKYLNEWKSCENT